MATTRGKGGTGTGAAGKTAATARGRETRTRAPEDDISGVAAPGTGGAAGTAEAPAAGGQAPKKRPGGKKRETYVETAARRRKEKEADKLQADLRAFAQARPSGWDHDDWLAFLAHLEERGHDVSRSEEIGARLERERLAVTLEAVPGLGPKRVQSLVDRFGTVWSLRHAGADEVAAVPGMTRPLAQRLVEEFRTRVP